MNVILKKGLDRSCSWLVSTVMFQPKSLKTCTRSLRALSFSRPDLVFNVASPSSRYRPMSYPKRSFSLSRTNRPISSQTSAPS